MLVLVPQRMWEASTFYFLKPVNMLCYKVKGGLHTQTRSWTILVYNPQPPRAHNTVGEIDIYKKKKKIYTNSWNKSDLRNTAQITPNFTDLSGPEVNANIWYWPDSQIPCL